MNLGSIAHEIDKRAVSRPIGRLQELRKEIKGLSRLPGRHIFSSRTTFESDHYAFHFGGRTELQFNIGLDHVDGVNKFRHGVGFSLERSQALPDIEVLRPKVERFNAFLKQSPQDFSDLWMWHYEGDEPSRKYRPKPISPDLFKPHVFIFLGRLQLLDQIDYKLVLDDFDRLLSLYQFVEGGGAQLVPTKTTAESNGHSPFTPGWTDNKPGQTTATMSGGVSVVNLRHNEIQGALCRYLTGLYGSDNVRSEYRTATGKKVDVVLRRGPQYWFYEIKIADSARACIRDGIGQLLEYSFWPGNHTPQRLIIVGEPPSDSKSKKFVDLLRERFSLPVRYEQFDFGKGTLVGSER